jgi:hypothetical protein
MPAAVPQMIVNFEKENEIFRSIKAVSLYDIYKKLLLRVLHKIGNIPLKMKIICLSDAAISRTES